MKKLAILFILGLLSCSKSPTLNECIAEVLEKSGVNDSEVMSRKDKALAEMGARVLCKESNNDSDSVMRKAPRK